MKIQGQKCCNFNISAFQFQTTRLNKGHIKHPFNIIYFKSNIIILYPLCLL